MKSGSTHKIMLLSIIITGFVFLSGSSFAQQKPDEPSDGKKTITIHITKVEDGQTIVIDTTVVTDSDFDADAFLQEKGVMEDEPGNDKNIEKQIIIRHPGKEDMEWTESDGNSPDTIIIHTHRDYAFNDNFNFDAPHAPHHADMPFEFYTYTDPGEFSHMDGKQLEDRLQDLARSFGLDDVMPFGEMKQIVVKKKRNGKKVIITFENKDKTTVGNKNKQEEKVIILKDSNTGMAPVHEKRIVVQTDPGEETTIEKNAPAKQEKKVIIIKEEKTK
jgi:hypothetical protein